jgi:murein DD-endopeptidase MepM/ murein hydrolase activator NlpD
VAGGRHAAGKHRRPAETSGVSRQKGQPNRLTSGGAPFAVAGVAVVAVAAAGGLNVSDVSEATTPSAKDADTTAQASLSAIPLDRQITALRTNTSVLAQRASRAQQRASLEEARRKAEQARKRAEALRPKFALPLREFRLTAGFGQSSNLWSSTHTGLDFAAPAGTPIRAVADGVIVAAGYDGAFGFRTIIRHEDGTETMYAHQSSFVRRSGKVKAGQVIGRVGTSGNSTGFHLHLEVHVDGQPINPKTWLRKNGLDL